MEPNIKEVAGRILALREDMDSHCRRWPRPRAGRWRNTPHKSPGEEDLSLHLSCARAEKFGVDVIELLTGENLHLTGYLLTREGAGLSIKRRAGFEYLHKAPHFRHRWPSPLWSPPLFGRGAGRAVHLSHHEGQEPTSSSPARCASPTRITRRS